MIKKTCLVCKKDFFVYPSSLIKLRDGKISKNLGKFCSRKCRIINTKISYLGSGNPMWKGDKVGYCSLHEWIKRYKPQPKLCEICNKKPSYDLANKSGKYLRDLSDWEYICRSCHMIKDGRMKVLHKYRRNIKTEDIKIFYNQVKSLSKTAHKFNCSIGLIRKRLTKNEVANV